jgi:AcrR family transcriptional regulator
MHAIAERPRRREAQDMPDADHPTRNLLLETALALADTEALTTVSVNDIAKAAGVAKGTFYVHFADRDEFLGALHDRFRRRTVELVAGAVEGRAPGAARLRAGCEAHLDGCLDAAGVKSLLSGARGIPVLDARIEASDARAARACAVDLEIMGDPHPPETARLLVAAMAEVVRVEVDGGRRPALRTALWDLFGLRI